MHPWLRWTGAWWRGTVLRLHGDQEGTISILTVFALLMLAGLLGMVMNAGKEVAGKIRMQNAADAAAYSGGVVLARGMNTLTFTNHLLFDVFALTAWAREANDQHSDQYLPDILAAWKKAGELFVKSPFPKFQRLGRAIAEEVPLEQEAADAFSAWAKAASEILLPTLEQILEDELIPEFQYNVVAAYPEIAQKAAMLAALENGRPDFGRGDMLGVLWRANAVPVGVAESPDSSLPVVPPSERPDEARQQRERFAMSYLGVHDPRSPRWHWHGDEMRFPSWNDQTLAFFDFTAKMSQYNSLFRGFSCGQLRQLLRDHEDRNLPYLIRTKAEDVKSGGPAAINAHLDEDFTFVGVAYWGQVPRFAPRIFRNPTECPSLAFAQVRLFVPHSRLTWHHEVPSRPGTPIGGIPGDFPPLPPGDDSGGTPPDDEPVPPAAPTPPSRWRLGRQAGVQEDWDLLNQHWTVQLVPATVGTLAQILQTVPGLPGVDTSWITLPGLGGLSAADVGRISTH